MESKIFSIGDIVALKSHPFIAGNTAVIISGDHLGLSPLMVVIEISKSSYKIDGAKRDTFRYDCLWFSTKSFEFEVSDVYEDQLQLIQKVSGIPPVDFIERGTKFNFSTLPLELGKKKSSLNYDDGLSSGAAHTSINSLLSFLPPVLQFQGMETYTTKHPVKNKEGLIRLLPAAAANFIYFNPVNNGITERVLPLEALTLIEEVPETRLAVLQKIIDQSGFLKIAVPGIRTIIKPKHIAYRGGNYFLRGFDYLSNKAEEFELKSSTKIKKILKPILTEVPKFDIITDPKSATPAFITKEVTDLIDQASTMNCYLRIKYLNRNDQLSYRTVKNMQMVTVKEDRTEVGYMIAYCLLRQDKRTFRVERIQSAQLLNMSYKTK